MSLAIEEAKKGLGRTSPNPSVGAVIVRNGQVIGRGYHKKAGTPHAEIHAIHDAGAATVGASIYVTLEPCNHTGKTPPCSHALLDAGFSRVVIGQLDPNPVASGGKEYLLRNDMEVVSGVCEQECSALNYPFTKHTLSGLPWVAMKAGMSLDARISPTLGKGGKITGHDSWRVVHRLRNRFDAILIGVETARIDNPSLTTRLEDGTGRDPLRVILDSQLRLSADANLFRQHSTAATWIFCTTEAAREKENRLLHAGAQIHRVAANPQGRVDLNEVLSILGKQNVMSVLVEGGAAVHSAFLQRNQVDEVYLFIAPSFIGDSGTPLLSAFSGTPSGDPVRLEDVSVQLLGQDTLIHGFIVGRKSPG